MTDHPGSSDVSTWVGRERTESDVITARLAESFDATFDRPSRHYKVGDLAPLGIHWLLCPPRVPQRALGPDGHPSRGGFLPPIELPRRMWASGRINFLEPFRVGEEINLASRIISVIPKQGTTGALVFVDVDHTFFTTTGVRLREHQTIVFRGPPRGEDTSTHINNQPPPSIQRWSRRRTINPDAALLFRYSALTFNGHRIHYDQDYVRNVEGYPNLVVHAPLTATLLLQMFEDRFGTGAVTFSFRAVRPLFCCKPIELYGNEDGNRFVLEARDEEHCVAMSAQASMTISQ